MCDEALNFEFEDSDEKRKASFEKLMACPVGPSPLIEEERARLRSEYNSFLINVKDAISTLKIIKPTYSQSDLWYLLLTEPKFYEHTKYFNAYVLKFLNRSFNETVVESEVSSLENVENQKRPLNSKTTNMLNFISTNGPHPLVSLPLVKDFLDSYFGKEWHFTLNNSKWYVSKVIDNHMYNAKNCSNSLL